MLTRLQGQKKQVLGWSLSNDFQNNTGDSLGQLQLGDQPAELCWTQDANVRGISASHIQKN